MPIVTRWIAVSCIAIHIGDILVGGILMEANCLLPRSALVNFQVTRFITYAFLHANVLHLVMNLISFIFIGRNMEKTIGSTKFGLLILQFALMNAVIYCFFSVFLAVGLGQAEWLWDTCLVGLSGVIFTLIVIFLYKFSTSESLRLFNFPVPNTLAPWILLIIASFLPKSSLLGHIVGLALGFAYVGNFLDPFMLPMNVMKKIELLPVFRNVGQYQGFQPLPDNSLPTIVPILSRRMPESTIPPPAPASSAHIRTNSGSNRFTQNSTGMLSPSKTSESTLPAILVETKEPAV